MNGRDGYTNAELVAMWPQTPNATCHRCRARGLCTWTLDGGPWLLCGECFGEHGSRVLSQEGTA